MTVRVAEAASLWTAARGEAPGESRVRLSAVTKKRRRISQKMAEAVEVIRGTSG